MRARYVNEVFSFERSTSDPLKNLSIGKRAQIVKWLDSYEIENYTINDDLTIDVNGNVDLTHQSLTYFPSFIKFNKVSGYFYCYNNQLISLEGCPIKVGGYFSCSYNQLTSLEGCPVTVGGGYYCGNNKLTSLEGCPITVGDNFSCSNNMLTSLEGCPTIVNGNFYCYGNNKQFSKEYVRSLCKVKGDIFLV